MIHFVRHQWTAYLSNTRVIYIYIYENILVRYRGDKAISMLYFVKWAHSLIKIRVINTNIRRLIAALSNGRRPLRFKLDQHRHIHINYTCLNGICPFNGNGWASIHSIVSPLTWTFHRLNQLFIHFHLVPKYEIWLYPF